MPEADREQVILELSFTVRPDSEPAFDSWLRDHLADVLQRPGALTAEICTVSPEPGGAIARVAQVRLANRAALDALLQAPANPLAVAKERFADAVEGSARVLDPKEQLSSGAPTQNCSNCGELLTGQYCAFCGQRAEVRVISLWELIRGLVGDVVNADSRVWRTLRLLVVAPGALTADYLSGQRAKFTPPFRLYLFVSLAGFLVSSIALPGQLTLSTGEKTMKLDLSEQQASVNAEQLETLKALCGTADETPPTTWKARAIGRLRAGCLKAASDPSAFVRSFRSNASKQMFVLLPIMALVATGLYWRPRRFYVEHLLFFVHLVCFATVAQLALNLLELLLRVFPEGPVGQSLHGLVSFAIVVAVTIYTWRAMRRVYGQRGLLTTAKLLALGFAYAVLFPVVTLGFLAFTALTL